MKIRTRIILLLAGLYVAGNAAAQTINDNYVKIYTAQKAITGDLSVYENTDSVSVTITYYDGLGRETQSVLKEQSPRRGDIVSFSQYDSYGRNMVKYLPYVASQPITGIIPDPVSEQKAFYTKLFGTINGNAALSETVIEHSELARIIEQGAPGADWKIGSGHTIKKQYLTNRLSDSIRHFPSNTFYPEKSLSCTKTIDEHGNDSYEFTDKEGRVVCKKVKAANALYAITYYVYDDFGNLVLVVTPEALRN